MKSVYIINHFFCLFWVVSCFPKIFFYSFA
ncbi:MAG: hypothetical protein IKS23_01175 [Alphaproteobacteria bacterium]|nr:hypothetical protein [Alphaproteobacteria bacterium]